MAKKNRRQQSKTSRYKQWQFWATAGTIVAAGLLLWLWQRSAPPPLPDDYQTGSVTYCLAGPAFTAELGFENLAIDTSQVLATGLVIRDPDDPSRFYQHETWDDAGNVGPFAYDNAGTIYLGPTPLASLQTNPTAEQNWIYAVNSQTAVMSKYLELPWPTPTHDGNPYGVTGLTYDCDTHSLYAASIAGSTAQEELGGIYQIDLETGEIVSQLNGRDAIGIGIFNGTKGKRLYFGLARSPDVYSVGLDAVTGHFYGEPRFELSLAAQPGGSFDNGRRIQFTQNGRMLIKGGEFSFSLQVASDPQRNIYTFQHEPTDDSWTFLSVQQE